MGSLALLLVCLAGAVDAGSRGKPFGPASVAALLYIAAAVIVIVTWVR